MLGGSLRAAKVPGLNHDLSSTFSLSPPTDPHRSSASVAPSNLHSIPCEHGVQNPPTSFPFLSRFIRVRHLPARLAGKYLRRRPRLIAPAGTRPPRAGWSPPDASRAIGTTPPEC